jgi:hypothetical protein
VTKEGDPCKILFLSVDFKEEKGKGGWGGESHCEAQKFMKCKKKQEASLLFLLFFWVLTAIMSFFFGCVWFLFHIALPLIAPHHFWPGANIPCLREWVPILSFRLLSETAIKYWLPLN